MLLLPCYSAPTLWISDLSSHLAVVMGLWKCKSALVILLLSTLYGLWSLRIQTQSITAPTFGSYPPLRSYHSSHFLLLFSHKEILLVAHNVPCLRGFEYTVELSANAPSQGDKSYSVLKFHLKHCLFWKSCPLPEQTSPALLWMFSWWSLFLSNTSYMYLVWGFPTFKPLRCMRADFQYMFVR